MPYKVHMSSMWLIVFKKLLNLLIKLDNGLSLVDINIDKLAIKLFSMLNRKKIQRLWALI